MSPRNIRRAAEHAARKQARKAGLPSNTSNTNPSASEPPTSAPQTNTSEAQRTANRANAQHSTGARTEAGRFASSQNRTVHGLARHNGPFIVLEYEDDADFDQLKADLIDEYQPVTATERILVNTMLESHWLANRAAFLSHNCTDLKSGLIDDPQKFSLYLRYETTHRRAFHKAMNDLLKLRKEMRKSQNGFEAQKQSEAHTASANETQNEAAAAPNPDPEFHFDPQNPESGVIDGPELIQQEKETNQAAA